MGNGFLIVLGRKCLWGEVRGLRGGFVCYLVEEIV